MEGAMPITDALILAAIVLAFAVFGIVLAWAEYQTRRLDVPRTAQSGGDSAPYTKSMTVIRLKTRTTEFVDS
jgi:hypothetical protein